MANITYSNIYCCDQKDFRQQNKNAEAKVAEAINRTCEGEYVAKRSEAEELTSTGERSERCELLPLK